MCKMETYNSNHENNKSRRKFIYTQVGMPVSFELTLSNISQKLLHPAGHY
jgi:hypothetical protein